MKLTYVQDIKVNVKYQSIGCCKFWNASCDINNDLVSLNEDVELIETNYLVLTGENTENTEIEIK